MNASSLVNETSKLPLNNFNFGYFILSMLTIITNLFLISIIIIRHIHNLNSTIMVSMCIVDICFASSYLFPRFAFPMSSRWSIHFCNSLPKLGISFIINLSFHLCLLSLDKYFSITQPFCYNKHATIKKGAIIICWSWMISIVVAFLPFYTYDRIDRPRCSLYSDDQERDHIYLLFVFIILFFVPLTLSVIVYVRLFIIVYKHTSRIVGGNNSANNRAISVIIKNKKVIFQVCAVIGMFAIFMTPYTICFLTIGLVTSISDIALSHLIASRYLAFAYPCINPIVYGYFMADIRKEIMTILRKSCIHSSKPKKRRYHHSVSQIIAGSAVTGIV